MKKSKLYCNSSLHLPLLIVTLLLSLTLLPFSATRAQDMKRASELYNGAVSGYKQNPQKAVNDLNEVLSITSKLEDEEAKKLAKSANLLMPKAYFFLAQVHYKAKKLDASVEAMEKARDLAEAVGDKRFAHQVNRAIPGIYYGAGLANKEVGKLEEAISLFLRATKANPKFLDPYVAAAALHDSLQQYEEMLATLEKGIAAAEEANNFVRADDMRVMAINYLKVKAQENQEAKKYNDAVALFERALTFAPKDGEVHFALAVCYQTMGKHEEALESVSKALEHAGDTTDPTPLYFLQAQEYQAIGRNDEACKAYKQAAHGAFKDAAEHQINEVLKCN